MNNNASSARILTYSGAIPFVMIAVLAVTGPLETASFDARHVLLIYSALIVSFLAGMHWHIALTQEDAPRHLMLLTNAFVLAAWGTVFISFSFISWFIFALLMVKLLAIDRLLLRAELLPPWFYTLRRHVSLIVVISLMVVGYHDALAFDL